MSNKKMLNEIIFAEFNLLNFLIRLIITAVLVFALFAISVEGIVPLVGDFDRYPLGLSDFGIIVEFTSILFITWVGLLLILKMTHRKGMHSTAKSFFFIGIIALIAYVFLLPPYLGVTFAP